MTLDAADRALRHLWRALPTGECSERDAQTAVLRAVKAYELDFARADAMLGSLSASGLLRKRLDDRMEVRYCRSEEFVAPEPNGPGTSGFNEALAAAAAREVEQHAESDQRSREGWAASPMNRTPEVEEVVRQVLAAEFEPRLAALRAQLDRIEDAFDIDDEAERKRTLREMFRGARTAA